jgi:hypothetical protein
MDAQRELFAPERGPATHCLTLWQPWAWCVAHGGKTIENRPLPPPKALLGQRLAIAAAARVAPGYETMQAVAIEGRTGVRVPPLHGLVRSAIVAVVTVAEVIDARANPALAAQLDRDEPWWLGPVGIRLTEVVAIEPFSIAGDTTFHRGYWKMPAAMAVATAAGERVTAPAAPRRRGT